MKLITILALTIAAFAVFSNQVVNGNPIQELQIEFNVNNYKTPITEPNDSILSKVKYLYDHDGIFVIIHNIKRLQYNMLEHSLVPKCDVLTNQEKADFMNEYNVNNPVLQLPEISRFDPQALVMCIRPGEIAKFTRESITSLEADYYRICI